MYDRFNEMECVSPIFDVSKLEATERSCIACIEEDPTNSNARLQLAWCLIIFYIYKSGQESILREQLDLELDPNGRTAKRLLEEGLLQATIVSDISTDPSEKNEVENLKMLVQISGAKETLAKASAGSNAIFRTLAYVLLDRTGPL